MVDGKIFVVVVVVGGEREGVGWGVVEGRGGNREPWWNR